MTLFSPASFLFSLSRVPPCWSMITTLSSLLTQWWWRGERRRGAAQWEWSLLDCVSFAAAWSPSWPPSLAPGPPSAPQCRSSEPRCVIFRSFFPLLIMDDLTDHFFVFSSSFRPPLPRWPRLSTPLFLPLLDFMLISLVVDGNAWQLLPPSSFSATFNDIHRA